MEKACGFCDFRTDDESAFAEHMRAEHAWDKITAPTVRRWSWRRARLAPLYVLAFGAGGAIFLALSGLPPFQVSDETGMQFELNRPVPSEVRYTDGWVVEVGAPSSARSADGQSAWIIPVAFTWESEQSGGAIGVDSCGLYVDGAYVDREPAQIRRLGDAGSAHSFTPRGETYRARLAVRRPAAQSGRVQLKCSSFAHVTAAFDLTPFLASVP